MSTKLDCSRDLKTALMHIDQHQAKLALTLLTAWQGCHKTHPNCPFRGEDCAVQDVIVGFLATLKAAD
jgi:hypothetical protein